MKWNDLWKNKYPILNDYDNQKKIESYENDIEKIYSEIQEKYGFNNLDTKLIMQEFVLNIYSVKKIKTKHKIEKEINND
ncbi:hypothetical protein D3C72_1716800 [compost metagenome]